MIKLKSFLYILSNLCVFSNKHSSDWSIVPTTANHITASPHHHVTASPHHRATASLRHHITASLHHHITMSLCHCNTTSLRHRVTTLVICLAPCHQASQSFALPPATKPVSHLPCPLPPHHRITALVSHLPCPLPPNQSVICLAPCHKTSQSFALPPTTMSPHHRATTSPHYCTTHHRVSQSFALPPATKPVSHLPCPLPQNQSVICLAPYHLIIASLCHRATASPRHHVTTSQH